MATVGSERVEAMVEVLQQWQGLERDAMNTTAEVIENTKNPLVRMVMEIIRHDSLMHHRVQQFLLDTLTEKDVAVTRDDVGEIWERIEEHDRVERKTIELAKKLLEDAWSPVHRQLLSYLLADENKHDSLIEQLRELTRGMNAASGG
jgi:hypothetical protein